MKLQNAYDTISDPEKRRVYDLRWPSIRDSLWTQQETEKRQTEAAQAEKRRAAEARAKKQQADAARGERLRNLEQSRWRYDQDIFELSRATRKLAADLKRLKELDDEDLRREKERNGWWAYLTSPISGQVKETDEEKQEREKKRVDRLASERIKGSELAQTEARLKKSQDAQRDVDGRITAEKKKAEDEENKAKEEARVRRLREAEARAMREARERMAEMQRQRAEQAAKEAREAQAARNVREAQERAWEAAAAAAAERRRREAEERAKAERRAAEEAAATAAAAKKSQSTCRHDGWWPKVEGMQLCSTCRTVQNRFALQCPRCKIVACASCQKGLRGARWKGDAGGGGGGSGRRYGSTRSNDYAQDDYIYFDYD